MLDQDKPSFEISAADAQVRRKLEFAYDKGRIVLLSGIALIVITCGAPMPFMQDCRWHAYLAAIFCWPSVPICGPMAVVVLGKAFRDIPAVTISQDGIYIEANFDETIPWRVIRDVRRYQDGFVDLIYFALDPTATQTFTRRGLYRWLPRTFQGQATLAIVSLTILRADRDWLYNRCLEFLAQDRLR